MHLTRVILATLAVLTTGGLVQAAEETLTLHHFLSPKSMTHQQLIVPWAERVAQQSDGRIAIEVFPSMSMGGKAPELYRQLRDGSADIVWTLIGYTPGVFPRSEVFELPTVHRGSSLATTLAIQDMLDVVSADYPDSKLLLLHVHAGNALHMVDKPVNSVADLKGLKLRTPSRTGAWLIEALDAEPVGMPVPALPQALSKGVVDGALVPFEIVPPLKLQELTDYSIEAANGDRFGTSVCLFAMNMERYQSLPEDLRAVIDANSGSNLAAEMGEIWMQGEQPGMKMQRASGGDIIALDAETMSEFNNRGELVVQRWVAQMREQGIDGLGLVEQARAAVEKHSN